MLDADDEYELGTAGPLIVTNDDVLEWRLSELLRLDVDLDTAEQVCGLAEVDLHDVEQLIRRGCRPATAIRILWPLDAPAP